MTPDRLMFSPSKKVFVFVSGSRPVQVGQVPHYRNKHEAVRAALKQGLLVDFAGRVTRVDDEDTAAYQAAHATLDTRPLEGTATLRTRVGTRVRFTPGAASLALYSNPPRRGEEGTVTTVAGPRGKMSSLKGPGGGLLYVKWDDHGTMGVAPQDIEVVPKSGVRAGKGRPGQRIETDDVVIETTLHPIEFDGAVRSLSFGQLPKFEEFRTSTKEHFPYPMELVGEDQAALDATGLVGEEGIDSFVPSKYPHKMGVKVRDAAAMYRLLQALVGHYNEGTEPTEAAEAAGDLASAILGTLGYEWV